jgi:hypothetical protein
MISSGGCSSPIDAWRIVTLAVAGAVLVQCSAGPPPPEATSPPSAAAPTAQPAAIQPVSAADLGASWHPGCPLSRGSCAESRVNYVGFDGQTHRGELIVHEELAADVAVIFDQLLQTRYPIDKIRTADNYPGGDDELSMEDNNTSVLRTACAEDPYPAAPGARMTIGTAGKYAAISERALRSAAVP